jgi:integrase/recombinase XerD
MMIRSERIADYLAGLRSRGYAPSTIHLKQMELETFFAQTRKAAANVTPEDVEAYGRRLIRRKNKNTGRPVTLRRVQARLHTLHRFFENEIHRGRLLANPAPKSRLRRRDRLPRHIPGPDQVRRLLRQPDVKTPLGLRDRAILELFYSTGLRRQELARLGMYDVDFNENAVFVRQGKGGKDRFLPLGKTARHWLEKYLQSVRRPPGETALFLTCFRKGFSPASLNALIEKYMAKAGLPWKMGCHLLRHACATHMLQGGAQLRYVQEILGHARIKTTEIYTHLHPQDLHAAIRRAHPHGRWRGERAQP